MTRARGWIQSIPYALFLNGIFSCRLGAECLDNIQPVGRNSFLRLIRLIGSTETDDSVEARSAQKTFGRIINSSCRLTMQGYF